MKQLKDYFNDYLEYMNKTYESRADWYNRCKSDKQFYYDEMEKYAISDAFHKAQRLQKRFDKVKEMPEHTEMQMINKAKYLWSISCNYRCFFYKDLINEFLSDESIAYCVDAGIIRQVDDTSKDRIILWTYNHDNELFFDNNLYKERFERNN